MKFSIGFANCKWLADNDLTIEDVFILKTLLDDNISLIGAYLKNKSLDQKLVYFQRLVRKGFIEMLVDINEFSFENYNLTSNGKKLIEFVISEEIVKEETIDKNQLTGIISSDINVVTDQDKENKFDKFVEEFREKFPEGKNGGNVSFKGNFIDIKNKLHKFMNKYRYDMSTILAATDLYLSGFRRKGFEYCQAAEYFILKNQTSTLAGYCDIIKKKGNSQTGSTDVFEKLM